MHQLAPSGGNLSSRRSAGYCRNVLSCGRRRVRPDTTSPGAIGPIADPPRRSTSSDTSTDELSPAMLGAIQRIVSTAIQEQIVTLPEDRAFPPSSSRGPPSVACASRTPSKKGLYDVRYRIEGAPEDKQQGVPFTEAVMAKELPANCSTPAITEYDGTTDPLEHLSRFENAALLHSNRKLRKTELNLFVVRQKDNEPLKEYLQRFNAATLEVPSATQEVKASAFSRGLLDGDFFNSLAKKSISKLMPSWLVLQNTLIWRTLKLLRKRVTEKNEKSKGGGPLQEA
ncbi:UNVERIFIED_CONTAM: hypothetical protein Slati_1400400 [Sesamum latifolium]|uniref:Retrotransposon gag domain-containing protein n=1 Tax=Sesamum latifolium TaxID=2727402 RepID=A0AAW2X8D7_9LAMI